MPEKQAFICVVFCSSLPFLCGTSDLPEPFTLHDTGGGGDGSMDRWVDG